MGKKKKIEKSIESLKKRKNEHKEKIQEYKESGGKNYELVDYWEREMERIEEQIEKEEDKLDKD